MTSSFAAEPDNFRVACDQWWRGHRWIGTEMITESEPASVQPSQGFAEESESAAPAAVGQPGPVSMREPLLVGLVKDPETEHGHDASARERSQDREELHHLGNGLVHVFRHIVHCDMSRAFNDE